MGGDFAPEAAVSGSFLALNELPSEAEIVLFGHRESIIRIADDNGFDVSRLSIVESNDDILMKDHPYKAFLAKKESSIVKGFKSLKAGEIDSFCSAGNTGAMMIGATQVINSIPGIIRPAIAALLPNQKLQSSILLDVGINPDAKPDVLYQYGILGKAYAQSLFKIDDPLVGLVNIGAEDEKGNLAAKSAFQLMKESRDYHFIGNVEANELFIDPRAKVLVCDGFVGNIILKEAEGFYHLMKNKVVGNGFLESFNFENFGGTPILGVNKPVFVGHGVSNDVAIKNMIIQSWRVLKNELISNIKIAFD